MQTKKTTQKAPLKQTTKQKPKPKPAQTSDMIGMPGTAFRKKVEAEIKANESKNKKVAPTKMKKC